MLSLVQLDCVLTLYSDRIILYIGDLDEHVLRAVVLPPKHQNVVRIDLHCIHVEVQGHRLIATLYNVDLDPEILGHSLLLNAVALRLLPLR